MKSSQSTVFETSTNRLATRITGRPGFIFPARCLLALLVLFGVILPATQVQSAIIQQPIAIDGVMSDWKLPADITTNPGQNSTDGENLNITNDLDYPVPSTGRDLKKFSFTYDAINLYMWVERYASTSNRTDWWFYIDTDNDALMKSTDKLLRVVWGGTTGNTTVELYNYAPAEPGGDSLVCELLGANSVDDGWCQLNSVGLADGYDMPGTLGTKIALSNSDAENQNGGSTTGTSAGVEMETRISWAALGCAGPCSISFHISTSNGSNIPARINDNMGGAGGGIGVITFPPDIIVLKSAQTIEDPVNGGTDPKSIPGAIVLYTITITNQGPGVADADSVIITDPIPEFTELFVGGPGSPVTFSDGAPSSGLSLDFTNLNDLTDDIEFSDDGGSTYTYTPSPNYDAAVTDLRLPLKGTFAASDGINHPSFRIIFQVRLQ